LKHSSNPCLCHHHCTVANEELYELIFQLLQITFSFDVKENFLAARFVFDYMSEANMKHMEIFSANFFYSEK